MAAAVEVGYEWLGWARPVGGGLTGQDGAEVGKRLFWVGLVVLGALAALGLARANEGPGSVAPRPSASSVAAARLPLPVRAALSRAVGADSAAYAAVGTATGAVMHNALQGLNGRFSAKGVRVETLGGDTRFRLRAYGYGNALRRVPTTLPFPRANSVVYPRGAVTERYTNGPLGIEQAFVIARPPQVRTRGILSLALAVSGTLSPRLSRDHRVVALRSDDHLVMRYSGLFAADAGGRPLRSWLELEGRTLLIRVDDRGARYPLSIDPFFQRAKLTASDGAANDFFGISVALSGDTAVVGSYKSDVGSNVDQGAAYVFVKPASGWGGALLETAKLTASDGASLDWFGYSVSIAGDTIAVGAPNAANDGAVYVFSRPASGWAGPLTETARLTTSDPSDPGTFKRFGQSVATSGDAVLSAAPKADVGGDLSQGAAYLFVRPASGWASGSESAKLLASDGIALDKLGFAAGDHAVAISGNTLVVGNGFKNNFQGAAYVWEKPASGWAGTLLSNAKLVASDGKANDNFGFGVAAAGDTVVVGAGKGDGGGGAYIFQRPASGWSGEVSETAKLTASATVNDAFFGRAVGISRDTIIVGGPFAASVFTKPASGWASATETQKLTAPPELAFGGFADFLGIADGTIIAGAPLVSVGDKLQQGAAYIFAPDAATGLDAAAPMVANVVGTPNVMAVKTAAALTAAVDDTATGDSSIASAEVQIDGGAWMPMKASDGVFDEPTENVRVTLGPFAKAGGLQVCVRGTDAAGNTTAPTCISLVVFDPSAGFVTGGAWIDSPASACPVFCRGAAGKARVSFVARYKKGASIPTGETSFEFQAGKLRFKSSSYQWLVVNGHGAVAQYGGSGSVNGVSGYGFRLTVYDAALKGVGSDGIRMKITDSSRVIYDNKAGSSDDNARANTQRIGGGNIVIHLPR
jgi:hypothetical protein